MKRGKSTWADGEGIDTEGKWWWRRRRLGMCSEGGTRNPTIGMILGDAKVVSSPVWINNSSVLSPVFELQHNKFLKAFDYLTERFLWKTKVFERENELTWCTNADNTRRFVRSSSPGSRGEGKVDVRGQAVEEREDEVVRHRQKWRSSKLLLNEGIQILETQMIFWTRHILIRTESSKWMEPLGSWQTLIQSCTFITIVTMESRYVSGCGWSLVRRYICSRARKG